MFENHATGQVCVGSTPHRFQSDYARKQYAKLKDLERGLRAEYGKRLHTAMLTLTASGAPEGKQLPPVDHLLELDGIELEYELTTTEEGADHQLFQLSQGGGRRIHHLLDAGITSLDDINEANRSVLLELPGIYDWHAEWLLAEAEAIRNDEFRVIDAEAFEFLHEDNVVLIDIETDLSQNRIWLIGVYSYRDDEFTHFFEKDDEEALLDTYIGFLKDHNRPAIVYYGNNRFDEECLKRRMEAFGKIEGITLMERSFDLGIEVNNNLLGSFRRTNLSSLSSELADYEYWYPEIDGFIVGSLYTKYLLDNEEPDWDALLEYNENDVLALKAVADEIRKLI